MRWQIYIGEYDQHIVKADTEEQAIKNWCNDQGYDSPDEAAAEYDLEGADVRAVLLG